MANSWQEDEDTSNYEEFTLKEPPFSFSTPAPAETTWKTTVGSVLMLVGVTIAAVVLTDLTMRAVSKWLD